MNLTNLVNNRKPVPKHKRGEKIGNITVTEVLSHSRRGLSKAMWWYETRCQCGNVEVLNQGQLRSRTDCKECMRDRVARSVSEARKGPQYDAGIPNFLTLRLTGEGE